MVTASGLAYHLGRRLRAGGAVAVSVVLLLALGVFIVGVATAGLLLPASEAVLVAPLRWK